MNVRMDRGVMERFGPILRQYRLRYGSLGLTAAQRPAVSLSPELDRMRPCLLKAQRAINENPELLAGGPVVESPLTVLFNFTLPRILPQLIVGERVDEALQFLCEYSKDLIDQRGVEGARAHLEGIFRDLPDFLDLHSDREMRGRNMNHEMIIDSPFRRSVEQIRDFIGTVDLSDFMGQAKPLIDLVFGDDLKALNFDPQDRISLQFKPTRQIKDQEFLFLTRPVFEAVRHKIVGLGLEKTGVTDQFLVAVGKLENLESLALYDTEVTDMGVKWLDELKNLKFLGLSRTKVTADALLAIAQIQNLEILGMDGIDLRVADRLDQLVQLQKLRELYLNDTAVKLCDLQFLRDNPALRVLSLNNNRFDDMDPSSLYLSGFSRLERLNLRNTNISEADKIILRQNLPHCEINT